MVASFMFMLRLNPWVFYLNEKMPFKRENWEFLYWKCLNSVLQCFQKIIPCSFRVINMIWTHVYLWPFWSSGFLWTSFWELEEWVWGCCQPALFLFHQTWESPGWSSVCQLPEEPGKLVTFWVCLPCPRAKIFNFAPREVRGKGWALQCLHVAGLCK